MSARAVLLLFAAVLLPVVPVCGAAEAPAPREAKVTYQTEATVYVDAGSEEGVAEGDILDVVRDGKVIAWLIVSVVSSHKSACRREDPGTEIRVGDVVQHTPRASAAASAAPATSAAPAAAVTAAGKSAAASTTTAPEKRPRNNGNAMRDLGLSGRIGLRYLVVDQPQTDYRYSQPGIELRLAGQDIGGSSFGVDIDVRSYQTYQVSGISSEKDLRNRVYRANVFWTGHEVPMRVAVGRLFSPTLASLSLFDGALVEYAGRRWSFGGLYGTQPDPQTYGFSQEVREYGAYAAARSDVGARVRWGTTIGLISSYDEGEINRDFLYLQGYYDDTRFSGYLAQEIDANRGWKREEEGSSYSLTSTFLTARYRISPNLTINGGWDNRRNVLLYRDYVDPVTDFDDAYRQGYWVGADGRVRWFRIGGNARFSRGGSAGPADSYSLFLGASGFSRFPLDVRTRSTFYTSDRAEGQLHSVTVGTGFGPTIHLAGTIGLRLEDGLLSTVPETDLIWYGIDFDISFARHWFYLLSFEQTTGGVEDNRQLYTSINYRF